MRQSITAQKRFAVILRFFTTGETYKSLSFASRIAHNTLSKIIPEVLTAMLESLQHEYIRLPKDPEEWLAVAGEYERQWNFPSGSFYRNYKGTDSIVLQL